MKPNDMELESIWFVQASCISDKGLKRSNNEDNYYCEGNYNETTINQITCSLNTELRSSQQRFFAVFDGMGGGEDGEIASLTAAQVTDEFLESSKRYPDADINKFFREYTENINISVFQTGNELNAYMFGTTVVAALFYNNQIWVMNIGDSRAYLFRDNHITQISEDHHEKILSAMREKRKPALSQYFGVDPEEIQLVPSIKQFELRNKDTILLCSDGLTDMVTDDSIQKILVQNIPLDRKADLLVNKALEAGGSDNITVMLINIHKQFK